MDLMMRKYLVDKVQNAPNKLILDIVHDILIHPNNDQGLLSIMIICDRHVVLVLLAIRLTTVFTTHHIRIPMTHTINLEESIIIKKRCVL
jgi:hypothetical protein